MSSSVSGEPRADVVILAALEKERDAIVRRLEGARTKSAQNWDRGRIGPYEVVVGCLAGMGNVRSAAAASGAIKTWRPVCVLLSGYAAGVNRPDAPTLSANDHRLGDVLIADQIVAYDPGKNTPDGLQDRPDAYRPTQSLVDAARSLPASSWATSIETPRPDGTSGRVLPAVHFGTIASGAQVVTNPSLVQKLKANWGKLIGIEMEGIGLAVAAAAEDPGPKFLMAKAISDWADPEKNDDWHQYAAEASAAFLYALLSAEPFDAVTSEPDRCSQQDAGLVTLPDKQRYTDRQPLHEILRTATERLLISGHTLDKFMQDMNVRKAFSDLLTDGVEATVILLNPHCSYQRAHAPFHRLESQSDAKDQIIHTIKSLRSIHAFTHNSANLTVYLSDYMPRFRVIEIDDARSYISLYMYGTDVVDTPDFVLSQDTDDGSSIWFRRVHESVEQLLASTHVVPLIRNGRFNDEWESTKISHVLANCLDSSCCQNRAKCWDTLREVLLGYQCAHGPAYDRLYDGSYCPGTFTLDKWPIHAGVFGDHLGFEAWLDSVIEEEVTALQALRPEYFRLLTPQQVVDRVRQILTQSPSGSQSLKSQIYMQEYSDVFRRLIFAVLTNNPESYSNLAPHLTRERKGFIASVLQWLEDAKSPHLEEWLHLSIAAGLLGVDEKSVHAATSAINDVRAIPLNRAGANVDVEKNRVAEHLWRVAKTECRLDATNLYFHILKTNKVEPLRIVAFSDDYLETIFLLKFYERLLETFEKVEIDLVPRSSPCGNDATWEDVEDLLPLFPYLETSDRFRIVNNGPKLGGVNLRKLNPEVLQLLDRAFLIDVRGARNYEMMQGLRRQTFFGFMVCRDLSEAVTGLMAEDEPLVFIYQPPGERSFDSSLERNRHRDNGKATYDRVAADEVARWTGGPIAACSSWPSQRERRFNLLREWYSNNAISFDRKWGDAEMVEDYVKDFLDRFTNVRGRVLVLGCGSGKEVRHLRLRGVDAYGVDFSSEAILIAHRRTDVDLKGCCFVEDFYNVEHILSGKLSGVVANASFVHLLERGDLERELKTIYERLEAGGLCYLRLLKKRTNTALERTEVHWVEEESDRSDGRWFVYFREDEVQSIAERTGFDVEEIQLDPHWRHADTVWWVSALLKKPLRSRPIP